MKTFWLWMVVNLWVIAAGITMIYRASHSDRSYIATATEIVEGVLAVVFGAGLSLLMLWLKRRTPGR